MKIYPSLIFSNLLALGETIESLEGSCDGLHIDVMDDHFVPNLTWGSAFVNGITAATGLPIHLHLMVDDPGVWLSRVSLRSEDLFVFHRESCKDAQEMRSLIELVRAKGWNVGVAINPKTSIGEIEDVLPLLNHVLVMTVQPGFSGQAFMPDVLPKVKDLLGIRSSGGFHFSVGVDGGVGLKNISALASLGVDVVGVASALFDVENYSKALENLYAKANENL
jgi:ribulose-phosphate 3-epimerase